MTDTISSGNATMTIALIDLDEDTVDGPYTAVPADSAAATANGVTGAESLRLPDVLDAYDVFKLATQISRMAKSSKGATYPLENGHGAPALPGPNVAAMTNDELLMMVTQLNSNNMAGQLIATEHSLKISYLITQAKNNEHLQKQLEAMDAAQAAMQGAPLWLDPAERWRWPIALAARMQTFERVVSQDMHWSRLGQAERRALRQLAPLGDRGMNAWHRRYSRDLIGRHPHLGARLPAMQADIARVALLNAQELAALATLCGGAILWPGIKAAIAREDVNTLRTALGETAYQWAIRHAPACHTGWLASQAWAVSRIVPACERFGWATLQTAMSDADVVNARFMLKLPVGETMALTSDDQFALPSSKQALSLCQSLLSFLAYPWLSSFNACR